MVVKVALFCFVATAAAIVVSEADPTARSMYAEPETRAHYKYYYHNAHSDPVAYPPAPVSSTLTPVAYIVPVTKTPAKSACASESPAHVPYDARAHVGHPSAPVVYAPAYFGHPAARVAYVPTYGPVTQTYTPVHAPVHHTYNLGSISFASPAVTYHY